MNQERGYRYEIQPLIAGLVTTIGAPARGLLSSPADSKGRAKATVTHACRRCGGGGGSDKWAHTGWNCYDCGGTGVGKSGTETIYTPAAYDRLEATRAKRAEKKAIEQTAKKGYPEKRVGTVQMSNIQKTDFRVERKRDA